MNIKEAKEEIINTVKAYTRTDPSGNYIIPVRNQRPILLMGPPGVGKTAIMEQIARETGIGLVAYTITHHTRQSAIGLPVVVSEEFDGKEYSITEYTMSEIIASIYRCMETTGHRKGILFIDEINCVSQTLMPTMLQFLQNKTFGSHRVPEGWIIVTAGNPVQYNKSARTYDIVTLDRVRTINVDADPRVWREYAIAHDIHPAILSYLGFMEEHFYKVVNTTKELLFVTARGWEDLSQILKSYEEMDIPGNMDLISQYLKDEDIAKGFADYYSIYSAHKKDYDISGILSGNVTSDRYEEMVSFSQNCGTNEQFILAGFITGGLLGLFKNWARQRQFLTDLKGFMEPLEKMPGLIDNYENFLSDKRHALNVKADFEVESQASINRQKKLLDTLSSFIIRLQKERSLEDPWMAMQDYIKEYEKAENTAAQAANRALDNSLIFADRCFDKNPAEDMIICDLSLDHSSAAFLSTYGSEEFFSRSRDMVYDNQREELVRSLSNIGR